LNPDDREKNVPPRLKIFADSHAVANAFANVLAQRIASLSQKQNVVSVSLSGGSTPKLLFEVLANEFGDHVDWSQVHWFWGDERCVPPSDPESNYGAAERLLLSKINVPKSNVHRIVGESDPEVESQRYAEEIESWLPSHADGLPRFDIVVLGMGTDGHTASIFPNQMELMSSPRICEIATHPESGQRRITLTGPLLNAAANVFFLVTGKKKASVLAEIFHGTGHCETYPAYHIRPEGGSQYYVDQAAGSEINA
jgi:6-phosphogluconolactonase